MESPHRPGRRPSFQRLLPLLVSCVLPLAIGCATPGVPRAPSLNLPEPPRDLTATRIGDTVELRFTIPSRSTDKLPLRGANLTATFCRALGTLPCQLASSATIVVPLEPAATTGRQTSFTWTDTLPSDFTHGEPRSLRYSVELLNPAGRSAGLSAPAFTAAGQGPNPVLGLHAEGSRLGILLRWDPSDRFPGDIVLKRQDLSPGAKIATKSQSPESIQLTTPQQTSTGPAPTSLLDTSAKPEISYRYTATRRVLLELAHHSIELRSAPSDAVELTLQTTYPPLSPTGLTAAAFVSTEAPHAFAVDLIWQPVDDAGLITPLAGYNLYRTSLGTTAKPSRLNSAPLTLPAFHDTTALPNSRYRYSVTAVDVKGNESPAAGVVLEP